jgi:hypothetical protein
MAAPAGALRLDEEEHAFLRELAVRAARRAPEPRPMPSRAVRPSVRLLLESVRPCPAYVYGRTNDLLAANPGGLRLLHGLSDWPPRQRNTIRYTFLHPAALIGELIVKSPDFARMWERYDVHTVGPGRKTFRHPVVGTMTLSHEVLQINGASGQRATVYLAEPGTPDHDKMQLLDLAQGFGLDEGMAGYADGGLVNR